MTGRRVVITGLGAVSCIGNNVPDMWDAAIHGRCGLGRVTLFDPSAFKTQIAGEIHGLKPEDFIPPKEIHRTDAFCIYALSAFFEAAKDAGLPGDFREPGCPVDPDRVGVCIGSGIGGMRTFEAQAEILFSRGPNRISPFFVPMLISNMASGMVSIRSGARGPNFAVSSACASGSHAIEESFFAIARGDADMMVCGGAESPVSKLGLAGFGAMKAMSTRNDDPLHASRPFDKNRDGFVMADGAGVLILEEYEQAKARGARIYAEIIGCGASCDAYHITSPAPGGDGGALAYRSALQSAGIAPDEVDYVNAHGTSTHLNDLYETQALKTVFGDHARRMFISSTKGAMGHSLGAAGGLETVICAKVLETGIIPPTINYEEPDPECDLDYTPNTARECRKVKTAINTNLGFGGHNSVIILRKI